MADIKKTLQALDDSELEQISGGLTNFNINGLGINGFDLMSLMENAGANGITAQTDIAEIRRYVTSAMPGLNSAQLDQAVLQLQGKLLESAGLARL